MGVILERKKRILLNEPHLVTTAPAGIASFSTDMIAPLKSCKVEFSPVQSGSGDPSPDNVRPISGWTGCNVTRCGKNLFDKNNINVINAYYSNMFHASSVMRTVYIQCKPNTTYTAVNTSGNGRKTIGYTSEVPAAGVNGTVSASGTITTDSNAKYLFVYCYNGNIDTVTPEQVYDALQIELGSTATPYEPYTGSTIPIDWTTEAGTVYGGYVDLVSGELVAETKKITATRFTGFFKSSDIAYVVYVSVLGGNHTPPVDKTHLMVSNEFVYTRSGYNSMSPYEYGGSSGAASSFSFALPKTITSMAEANAWAAANPIEFTYYLATPITYQLTPTQLKSLRGVNNIWSDANGDTAVKYWTH